MTRTTFRHHGPIGPRLPATELLELLTHRAIPGRSQLRPLLRAFCPIGGRRTPERSTWRPYATFWWETIGCVSWTERPSAMPGSFRGCRIPPLGFHSWIFALPI
jgi:hypothetical protein